MLRRIWPQRSTVTKLFQHCARLGDFSVSHHPEGPWPGSGNAQMRLHDGPQDLSSFGQSALDVVDHAVDVGQHACDYAARVHLGMARQKAGDDGLKRDHAAVQVRGCVVLGSISH
jgi:hypothetical protein